MSVGHNCVTAQTEIFCQRARIDTSSFMHFSMIDILIPTLNIFSEKDPMVCPSILPGCNLESVIEHWRKILNTTSSTSIDHRYEFMRLLLDPQNLEETVLIFCEA